MNKVLLIAIFCLFTCFIQLHAQSVANGRLLNAIELQQKKTFYSLEEALLEPENVYKLSLSGQKLKEIPADIGLLKNLQWLNLSDNKLKELPIELAELHNLEFLSIFGNRLKIMPEPISNLKNLRVLYLGKNKLSEMPLWMRTMKKMVRLDVSTNRFTPREIQYIRNMMPHKVDITF